MVPQTWGLWWCTIYVRPNGSILDPLLLVILEGAINNFDNPLPPHSANLIFTQPLGHYCQMGLPIYYLYMRDVLKKNLGTLSQSPPLLPHPPDVSPTPAASPSSSSCHLVPQHQSSRLLSSSDILGVSPTSSKVSNTTQKANISAAAHRGQ